MSFLLDIMIIFLLHFEALKGTKYLNSNIEYWTKFILPKIRNPYLQNYKIIY